MRRSTISPSTLATCGAIESSLSSCCSKGLGHEMNIFLRILDLVELQLFQGWIKVVVFYIYIVLYGSVADP
jgi:hypothetical protein